MENQNLKKILPVYEYLITDEKEDGVFRISLVNEPAIQVDWVTFSQNISTQFKTISNEKRIVMAPVLIPNQYVFRGEYYVTCSKEVIEKASKNHLMRDDIHSFNINHQKGQKLTDVFLIESWLTGKQDKAYEYFDKEIIKEGSWMVTLYIKNENTWNDYIKTGKINAFSMEGYFAKSLHIVDTVLVDCQPKLVVNNSVVKSDNDDEIISEIISILKD